jgi:hypothetical protein
MEEVNQIPIDGPMSRRTLIAEADIIELHHKKGIATEEDFKEVLRRYNLRDGLITLGQISNLLFDIKKQRNEPYCDPNTGVIITQFALAYLANILLISGANDYKSKYISQKDNLLTLCNSYSNCLIDHILIKNEELVNQDDLRSFMIRIHSEQIEYQFSPAYMISRTVIMFNEIAQNIQPNKFESLSKIFEKETGLSLFDYLYLCFIIFAASHKTATFSIRSIVAGNIPQLKDLLVEEKVTKILNILKADYKTFRVEDTIQNKNLNPIFTKTRFNPLLIYPIIETDAKHSGDPYVIPNVIAFLRKSFGGLYWWFHRYFETQGRQQDFHNYFGYIFQEYVGKILKNIYGENTVQGEIIYGNNLKFIDWWVEKGNKIYLFEAKANQFRLLSKQTGDRKIIIKNEIETKVVDAISQVYKRIQDIPKYEELKKFQGKQIIPIIVFMDMPFISTPLYAPWIKEALMKQEKKMQITGLANYQIFLMDIEELELYDECADIIGLDDIFLKLRDNIEEGFLSILSKIKGKALRNRYLDMVYKTLGEEISGVTKSTKIV